MRSTTLRRATIVAVALAAAIAPPASSSIASVAPPVAEQGTAPHTFRLPPLDGHTQSEAYAINAAGEVAGWSFGAAPMIAVIWDSEGNPTALPPLPGDEASQAEGINDAGTVVGRSLGPGDAPRAVMWGPDRIPVELPHLPGHTRSRARDINGAGVVIGQTWTDGAERAVMWRPDGTIIELTRLPGDPQSVAYAINDEGFIVGKSQGPPDPQTGDSKRTAMVWTPEGQGTTLVELPGDEGAIAAAINEAGTVVGEGYRTIRGDDSACFYAFTAVVWDLDGNPRGLPPLPGEGPGTPVGECVMIGRDAWGVSSSGIIVGFSASHERGVLWGADGRGLALPPLPNDTRTWAYDINEAGRAVGFSQGASGKRTAVFWR